MLQTTDLLTLPSHNYSTTHTKDPDLPWLINWWEKLILRKYKTQWTHPRALWHAGGKTTQWLQEQGSRVWMQNPGCVTCRVALWWVPPPQCMTGAWSPGWSLIYTSSFSLLRKISIGLLWAVYDETLEFLNDAWRHSCRNSLRSYVGNSALCLSSTRMKSICFLRIPLQWLDYSKLSKHFEGKNVRLLKMQKKSC